MVDQRLKKTSCVNKETQETLSEYKTEQLNNKGHSDVNDVKDRSTKPGKNLHESITCQTDGLLRSEFVMKPKSTTGKTDQLYVSNDKKGSLLPPDETERSYENKSVKRPFSAMPAQNRHIPEGMSIGNFTKSKSKLATTYINERPDGLILKVNNFMSKSDVML
ncbi:unnamed protein product [Mytilus coruscus]|uniref:Uncharacterized protein n=1 Tax=Mytilus coruscus TaxID=42192 RepID=A0A6J8EXN8_MYTCO|nr:unnamed protein product [Mytilus coruscus]